MITSQTVIGILCLFESIYELALKFKIDMYPLPRYSNNRATRLKVLMNSESNM